MSGWKLPCSLSLLLFATLGACGPQATVCEQAKDKILTCMGTLNCDSFTDPSDKADCLAARENAAAAAPAAECTGGAKTQSETLMKCTLDPQRLCVDCTDDTRPASSEEPPANGAKLFAWNSCYDGGGDTTGAYGHSGCLEQWGSYAASCLKIQDRTYARGKRCKNLCNVGVCSKGCFNLYKASTSVDLVASFYQCN